ncbi:PAS domain S-box protein [uncultured Croceitalea sp.]|uniref:PAS domain-containing sensor histidine kinase n=1 Tax=uncultured Croceitalea sp. TaxID=1798908 RepID=UPI00374EA484
MIESGSNIDVSIISFLPYPVALLDYNNCFIECSDAWTIQFNKKKSVLLGKNIFDTIPLLKTKFEESLISKNNKKTLTGDADEVIFSNGFTKWLKWKVQHISISNVDYKFISIEDITIQKKREELITKAKRVARIGYWEVNLNDNSVLWSDITREIHETATDYQPTLEEGINFYKEGKYRDLISELVTIAINEGKPWDTELIIVTAKGNEVWVKTKGEAERVNGKPVRIFGTFQDIDEKKRAELKFNEASERLALATKEAKIGIWQYNVLENELIWDDNMFSLYGIKKEDFSGAVDAWERSIHPDDKEQGKKDLAMAISGEKEFDTTFRIIKPNGNIFHIKAFATVERDNKGNPLKMLGTNWDITDLKTTRLQLQRSEESFVGAFENSSIGMALVGLDGKWMQVNNSICNSLGYNKEELMELTFQDITYQKDLEKDINQLHDLINGKTESYQISKRYVHKKGKLVHALLTVTAVHGVEGHLSHFISQVVDVTKMVESERKLKDYLQVTREQNHSLINFAHIVSHNLRSHSTNMSMLIDFLIKEDNLEEANKIKEMLRSASNGLTDTVTHLNEVIQVRTSTLEKMRSVNLQKSVYGTLRNLEAQIEELNPVLKINVPKQHFVNVVPAYLDSILLNLFTNAIKYCSPKRKLEINVTSEEQEGKIIIKFRDNGLGLDLGRYGTRVFGMFKTFHNHKDAKGIGLFITKNQIEAMRGKIEIESSVDVGTTFIMKYEKPML